jgi:DNA-binding transcriptional LysR family regulator
MSTRYEAELHSQARRARRCREVSCGREFRRAAAALGVTPSAVSQAVRAFETRIGAALLARATRSVSLTGAGSIGYDDLEWDR